MMDYFKFNSVSKELTTILKYCSKRNINCSCTIGIQNQKLIFNCIEEEDWPEWTRIP